MPGVVRTRVGYAGGTKQSPTYHALGDHSETIQIDYDPSKITYQDLLDAFWSGHDPRYRSWSRQYASFIFVHNDEQRRLAEESRTRIAKERGSTIHTEIEFYRGFTLAENYHQKHALQQFPAFLEDLQRIYPVPEVFVASTAVARMNGYLGGEGSFNALLREVNGLGLSAARKEELFKIVQRRKGGEACPVPEK
jgi:peptide-methionine (S)-S-oxide reductase